MSVKTTFRDLWDKISKDAGVVIGVVQIVVSVSDMVVSALNRRKSGRPSPSDHHRRSHESQ
jgi:hypothetical protein